MRKFVFESSIALLWALGFPFSRADVIAPDVLLKAVTLEVIAIIRQDGDIQADVPAKIADQVEARILPLFDFTHMTQTAMARNWRRATPAQQDALTSEFKTLLVRTYSTALSSYRSQSIEFKRLRTVVGATEVTVKSVIKRPGAAPLAIDYDMEKMVTGWKVYDIKIEGVSLITAYRETFAGKIREGGVASLISLLADKNRQGNVHPDSQKTQNFYGPVILRSILLGRRY